MQHSLNESARNSSKAISSESKPASQPKLNVQGIIIAKEQGTLALENVIPMYLSHQQDKSIIDHKFTITSVSRKGST